MGIALWQKGKKLGCYCPIATEKMGLKSVHRWDEVRVVRYGGVKCELRSFPLFYDSVYSVKAVLGTLYKSSSSHSKTVLHFGVYWPCCDHKKGMPFRFEWLETSQSSKGKQHWSRIPREAERRKHPCGFGIKPLSFLWLANTYILIKPLISLVS